MICKVNKINILESYKLETFLSAVRRIKLLLIKVHVYNILGNNNL